MYNRLAYIILIAFLIPVITPAQVTNKSSENAFYAQKQHFLGKTWQCDPVNTLLGDLNADGKIDALIQYSCSPKGGGNAVYTIGWAVFLNQNGQPTYTLHDSKRVPWVIESITKDGQIVATQYEYAPGDGHCCPSIKTPHLARLGPTGFVIIK